MTTLLWLLVIVSFILAFVSLVVPIIPGVLMMWIGFLIYHFAIDSTTLSWFFWIVMIIITALMLVSDYVAGSYFVKRYGGSKAGEITALISVIVGSFVYPPFGIILFPLIAVFIVELLVVQDMRKAMDASLGSLLGFLASTFAKLIMLIVMIVWFIIDVFINL
ncbi:DUF456 domain-containing protein [Macrococcus brunensis]|uniref:DUF456 domain-containing protein n=1 Tax=Macrococcus brunensis TaxID=198483 RepID=UPI001EF08B70|nr:DUF456 domain-containing protein [Macrococcus brunensis]ULG72462.1 DUF456 domain-containing protein [Macrococcus brunensis]ULG74717.1 DUF456 domain-containing protein [Macrococcus brunensis]